MPNAARDPRGTRLVLCALGLVLGLLGMHGLASDHTVMHGMSPTAAAHTMASPVVGHLPFVAPDADHHAPGGTGALCLAVLGAGLLVLGLARVARRSATREPAGTGSPRAPSAPALLRPPDPVALLCVSRT